MEKTLSYTARPGNLALSMVAFCGISLLAAFLWEAASGYVILLFIPALALCFYQMTLSLIYGLKIALGRWTVMTEQGDRVIASEDIAFLRISPAGRSAHATLVLRDGEEVAIPFDLSPDPLELIQISTECGVPVRTR